MTRFEREINGSLGDFWKRNAQEEVKKAAAKADADATVEADGAIKWNSNGRYLMDDFCEKLEYAGYPFSREATARKRDSQNEESLAEYRRNDGAFRGGTCTGKGGLRGRHHGGECADRKENKALRHQHLETGGCPQRAAAFFILKI